jgi:hypothetical protein
MMCGARNGMVVLFVVAGVSSKEGEGGFEAKFFVLF